MLSDVYQQLVQQAEITGAEFESVEASERTTY